MRLVCIRAEGRARHAVERADGLHEIAADPGDPQAVAALLQDPAAALPTGRVFDPARVDFLPPVLSPGKIFCVATNFREPTLPDRPAPEYPLLFTRFADTLVGHGQPLRKPDESDRHDFEGELAVVIGKPGFRITRESALAHVAGYSCFNDGSIRDWQKHSTQFTPGKNFFASGSFGPALVTADGIDPAALRLTTRMNGVVMQQIGMDRMIFGIDWLIAYVSAFAPLAPGDVIVTGTPTGFGSSRTPPRFLTPGDVVEVEITGIGTLRNAVVAANDFVM